MGADDQEVMEGGEDFCFDEEVPENTDEIDGVPTGTWYDVTVESLKVFGDDASRAKRLNMRLKVDGPTHVGESFFVSYPMPFPGEHSFARNMRLAMCIDTGLISKEDQGQSKRIDYGRLKGSQHTVWYESSPNKKDPTKPYKQIAFHGWHPLGWRPEGEAGGAPAEMHQGPAAGKQRDFADI
jgi:hypothetical protein